MDESHTCICVCVCLCVSVCLSMWPWVHLWAICVLLCSINGSLSAQKRLNPRNNKSQTRRHRNSWHRASECCSFCYLFLFIYHEVLWCLDQDIGIAAGGGVRPQWIRLLCQTHPIYFYCMKFVGQVIELFYHDQDWLFSWCVQHWFSRTDWALIPVGVGGSWVPMIMWRVYWCKAGDWCCSVHLVLMLM